MGQGSDLLGLEGHVEYHDLARLLRGCHPESGRFLPAWKPARRRAGWDLTLAAPKSVSLLAALAAGGDEVTAAHRAAVHDVVDEVERLLTVRRAPSREVGHPAPGPWPPASTTRPTARVSPICTRIFCSATWAVTGSGCGRP